MWRHRFLGDDETCADIAELATECERRQHILAVRDAPGQNQRAVIELPDFIDQRDGVQRPRVAPGARRNQNQPVDTGLDRFARMLGIRDVMQNGRAVLMDPFDDFARCVQRSDVERHLMLGADFEIPLPARIRGMNDQVDAIRRYDLARVRLTVGVQTVADFLEPD